MNYEERQILGARWHPAEDAGKRVAAQELEDRFIHAEVMTEDEMFAAALPFKVADFPSDGRIMRQCKLTDAEFEHITGKRAFRTRYSIPGGFWKRYTPHVIDYLRSFLLRDYVTPTEERKAKEERARVASAKYAMKQTSPYAGMTPEEKAAAVKAKISEKVRAAWARKKEQKGNT